MKKALSLIIAVLIISLSVLPAFADMGAPSIDPFDVYALPGGAVIVDYDDVSHKVPTGGKITIIDKYTGSSGSDEYYGSYGDVYGVVDMSHTIGAKEVVSRSYGDEEKKTVRVTADVGLILRSGPNQNYEYLVLIPMDTKLTYSAVYHDSMDWGFVTYKGQNGWVSLTYAEEVKEKETTTKKETTEKATTEKATTDPAKEKTTAEVTEEAAEEETTKAPMSIKTLYTSVTSNRVVLICIIAALLLFIGVLIALIIIILTKKKQ